MNTEFAMPKRHKNHLAMLRPLRGRRMALVATLALVGSEALATEGGGNSYPVGVETNYNGLMLPEGAHGFLGVLCLLPYCL